VNGWAAFHKQQIAAAKENFANGGGNSAEAELPPLPDESQETGVLARVIKSLVQRRRQVKGMMKKESNSEKYNEVRCYFLSQFFCRCHVICNVFLFLYYSHIFFHSVITI
jgi:hypothetical protein